MTKYKWVPHDTAQPEPVVDLVTAINNLLAGKWHTK